MTACCERTLDSAATPCRRAGRVVSRANSELYTVARRPANPGSGQRAQRGIRAWARAFAARRSRPRCAGPSCTSICRGCSSARSGASRSMRRTALSKLADAVSARAPSGNGTTRVKLPWLRSCDRSRARSAPPRAARAHVGECADDCRMDALSRRSCVPDPLAVDALTSRFAACRAHDLTRASSSRGARQALACAALVSTCCAQPARTGCGGDVLRAVGERERTNASRSWHVRCSLHVGTDEAERCAQIARCMSLVRRDIDSKAVAICGGARIERKSP
jgi:hypothetical protein